MRLSPMQWEFELGEDDMELPRFTIDGEINRRYGRFNAVGTAYSTSPTSE
jgi:hypothetical protein